MGYPNKLVEQEIKMVKFLKNGNVVRQKDPRKIIYVKSKYV